MGDLEEFTRGLHAHDMDVRLYSINSIAQLGPSAASAIPELVALLDDKDEDIARLSLRALAYLGPAILPLKPRFAHLLQNPRPGIRQMAAFALSAMGTSAANTVPILAPMLNDEDPGVQMYVMLALGSVTDDLDSTVLALRQALEREDGQTRAEAEEALRREYATAKSRKLPLRDESPPPPKPLGRRTVRVLDQGERSALADWAAGGRAMLTADPGLRDPADVVDAIAAIVDEARAGRCRLSDDEARDLSALLGEQIRTVTGWSWVVFSADGLDRSILGLVAPDLSLVCIPAQTIHASLADKDRVNSIPLLFRVMAENRLPPAEADSLELLH
jgi:HEAT repeats